MSAMKALKVKVNGKLTQLQPGALLPSLRAAGVDIPAVCWHPDVSKSGGRCRVCVCQVDGRLVPSCNTPVPDWAKAGDDTNVPEIVTDSQQLNDMRAAALALVPYVQGGSGTKEVQQAYAADDKGADEAKHETAAAAVAAKTKARHFSTMDKPQFEQQGGESISAHVKQVFTSPIAHAAAEAEAAASMKPMPIKPRSKYIIRHPELCVHCNLCVDVCSETQGVAAVADVRVDAATEEADDVTATSQGEIGTFKGCTLSDTECITCGQCVNVCPTGALAEATEIDQVEMGLADKKKVTVFQFAPAVRVALAEEFGLAPGARSLTHEMVTATRLLGAKFGDVPMSPDPETSNGMKKNTQERVKVFDTNYTADLTIIEEGYELLERLRRNLTKEKKFGADDMEIALPMITSCSPGWVQFCEKNYWDLIPNLSSCKSPMQMAGAVIKRYWADRMGLKPEQVNSVAVMPCTAKKLEKEREEFMPDGVPDIDNVLTTREFAKLLKQHNIDPLELEPEEFDDPFGLASGAGLIFGATGGVMEAALRTAYAVVTGRAVPFKHLDIHPVRGMEGVKEADILIENVLPEWSFLEGAVLKVAVAHGTLNARKLMDRVRDAKERGLPLPYHFIEVMACPGGCLGGGGQPKPTSMAIKHKRASLVYKEDGELPIRMSHENPAIKQLYAEHLGDPLGHRSHHLLHTTYQRREPESAALVSTEEAREVRTEVLHKHPKTRTFLPNVVSDVVDRFGHVSDPALAAVADHTGITPVQLDAILSHYHFFPRHPNHTNSDTMVYICECQHCRRKGALKVRDYLKAQGIPYHSASWLGWCVNGAPAALVKHTKDGRVHHLLNLTPGDERLSAENLAKLDNPVQGVGFDVRSIRRDTFAGNDAILAAPSVLGDIQLPPSAVPAAKEMHANGRCPVSASLFDTDPEVIIGRLKTAMLRGCGGAGFPTHFKWGAVRRENLSGGKAGGKQDTCVVVNADEGLPNTFKDYFIMQDDKCRMRMIVGMCLGCHVVGATQAVLYLRYEYRNLKPLLEKSFEVYKSLNPLVSNDLKFTVCLGGGPYICGEETALFESVEGHTPQARSLRSVFPTHHGLFGRPTLVGNVETFAWVPHLAYTQDGAERFAAAGATAETPGVKLLSVSGDVAKPVLAEFPMGSKLGDVLEDVCGFPLREVAAVEVGGALEVLVGQEAFERRLTLDGKQGTLPAGGSVVVYREGQATPESISAAAVKAGSSTVVPELGKFDPMAVYQAKAKFANIESCQLCAVCRDGTKVMRGSMRAMVNGDLSGPQAVSMHKLAKAMEVSSNCGHGKAAGHLARVVMDNAARKQGTE